jgi:maltose-binding protein MalE
MRYLTKVRLHAFMLALMLLSLGAGIAWRGAAAQDAADTGCTPQAEQVDNLVFWTRATEDLPEWGSLVAVAEAYTAATGSPVELVTVPDADFRNRMSLAAPAGEGPDVFGPVAHDWLGEFAIQEIAAEIDRDNVPGADDVIPVAFDSATVDGALYGLPLFVESVGLIYNKDLVPTPPTTWEELVTVATELTADGNYGFAFPLMEQYHEGAFFNGFGSYIFNYEDGQFDTEDIGLATESGVEAASFLRDMYHEEQPPMPEVVLDRANQHAVLEGMMEAGELAMTINGPWREAPLKAAGINYGIAKLPSLPNGDPMRPFLGFQVMGANAYSDNLDAAIDFITFATCTENVIELYEGYLKVPVRQSALDAPALQEDPNIPIWQEQAADGVPMPNIPAMSQVWVPWGNAMDAIIPPNAPEEEVQSLLDNATEQIKEAIEQSQQ